MLSEKKQKMLYVGIFIGLGIILMQIPFTALVGADAHFTMFDFYGPIIGGLLGSVPGMLTVLAMQLVNWAWHGFSMEAVAILRFFPMLFAVLYFSKKSKWMLLTPVIAMIVFWAHPEGRQAWYFALYWLIPIASYFFYDKWIYARALGTTFTAHAVGGALWVWTFNMKAALWISLIPVVWKERGLMAGGIAVGYLAFNGLLAVLAKKGWVKLGFLKLQAKNV